MRTVMIGSATGTLRVIAMFVLLACGIPGLCVAQEQPQPPPDNFRDLAFILGKWTGTSSGQPGEGTVERDYGFVLRGRFIRSSSRSTYAAQPKNPKGEIHEDTGFISFDRGRKRHVMRQFYVEDAFTQFVAETEAPQAGRWVFVAEASENFPLGPGWRSRETYIIQGPDEFEEVFEVAGPGKDFQVYSRSRLRRAR
jgi:hypothetical protein